MIEGTSTCGNRTNNRQRSENKQSKQHKTNPKDMNNVVRKSSRLVRKNISDILPISSERNVSPQRANKVQSSSRRGRSRQKKVQDDNSIPTFTMKPTPSPPFTPNTKQRCVVTKSGRVVKKKNLDFETTPSSSKTDDTVSKGNGNKNMKSDTKSTKGEVISFKSRNKRMVKTIPNEKSKVRFQLIDVDKAATTSKTLHSTPKSKTMITTKSPKYKKVPTSEPVFNNKSESPKRKTISSISKIHKVKKVQFVSPKTSGKKVQHKNLSFKLLEDEENPRTGDVYEFTFDPSEEPPPPQKKKRKRIVKRKPAMPNTFYSGSNYEKNLSRTLSRLKSIVSKNKPMQSRLDAVDASITELDNKVTDNALPNMDNISKDVTATASSTSAKPLTYNSVHVEDIAAHFNPSVDEHHDDHCDIDYSPVNSPICVRTPTQTDNIHNQTNEKVVNNSNDPLNLQDALSFFEEPPVANSSMISVRHAEASPWRVEFEKLPIKWHVNTYVKPNMTPAFDSSFINFDEGKKKQVYTNMVPQSNEVLPEILTNKLNQINETRNAARYRQPSIISFIREVAEKSAKKKANSMLTKSKKKANSTPTKNKSIFDHITSTPHRITERLPCEALNPTENESQSIISKDTTKSSNSNDSNECEENSEENGNKVKENRKRKNDNILSEMAAKSPLNKDKDNTFFGFDDTEEDQENIAPVRNKHKKRTLRPHLRGVLRELNAQAGPMRATVPTKSKFAPSSEIVHKLFNEIKSGTTSPEFPLQVIEKNVEMTDANENSLQDDDSQSVHLFEDLEVVHHLKPVRKSYDRAKKVTFQQHSGSEDLLSEIPERADFGDNDLTDLSFKLPKERTHRTKKKQTKKNERNKKEEREVEAWAASFNSMCEDVDEFSLIVE